MNTVSVFLFIGVFVWCIILTCIVNGVVSDVNNIIKSTQNKEEDNTKQMSLKDVCEHSWHTLVNEQQGEQKIIVIECVKCGFISKDVIGRCNHEWDKYEDFSKKSKYEVAIDPVIQLANNTFHYSKSSEKFKKIVDEITGEWFGKRSDAPKDLFDRTVVRTRTCKKCGEIFVLDLSQQSASVQLISGKQQMKEQEGLS